MALRPWNHNIQYYDFVVRLAAPDCQRALDVGCGQGLLAQRLAQRYPEVIAIDADRTAISRAKLDRASASITFIEGDVMTYPFPDDSFDLIALVASIHHLPLRPAMVRFQKLLRPGGVLAVVGLYRGEKLADLALAAVAFPVSWILRLFRGYADVSAPVQPPRETLREIRNECGLLLPGASLRRRLFFRYTLTWSKPSR